MSGKVHSRIGVSITGFLTIIYSIFVIKSFDSDLMILLLIGALVGSLMPDIDSVKSKASQQFTQVVFYLFIALGCVCVHVNVSSLLSGNGLASAASLRDAAVNSELSNWLIRLISMIAEPKWFIWFAVVACLGKLSPHRQFTHKWFGTFLFFTTAWLSFNHNFSIGFMCGYILHIIADAITPDGWFTAVVYNSNGFLKSFKFLVADHATKGNIQNKSFLDFKLPMTDSKNKFKAHLGIIPVKSKKVHH